MPSLTADVRDIIEELDADGGGFRTGEAAALLVSRVAADGICESDGSPKPKVRTLMRTGAGVLVKQYTPAHNDNKKRRAAVVAALAGEQRDFGELAEDWEYAWLMDYAAFDDTEDAERKVMIRMTRPELLRVIALREKKATEAEVETKRLKKIIDEYPQWADQPLMTVADVLGIKE